MRQHCAFAPNNFNSILGWIRQSVAIRTREGILHLYSVLVGLIWSAGSISELLGVTYEWAQKGLWGEAEGTGLVQPLEEKLKGTELHCWLPSARHSKDGAGLFLKVNRERQETMETSSKTGNFSCTRTKSAELGTEAERGSESSILGRVQNSSG